MRLTLENLALIEAIGDELTAVDSDLNDVLDSLPAKSLAETLRALDGDSQRLTAYAFRSAIDALRDQAEYELAHPYRFEDRRPGNPWPHLDRVAAGF